MDFRCGFKLHDGAVATNDAVRRKDEESRGYANEDDDDKGLSNVVLVGRLLPEKIRGTYNIRRRGHSSEPSTTNVDSKGDHGTDERAKLEYCPENAKCFAFIFLERIAHHDTTLRGPEKCGCESQDGTREYQEPSCSLHLEAIRQKIMRWLTQ